MFSRFLLLSPRKLSTSLLYKCSPLFGDKLYLSLLYYLKQGERMHWRHPVLFQEKMQWLKLHDRKSIYTDMVDKFKVKSIVSQLIGEDYIIPTLGVWDCFEDIDFTKLPNQFVLKCTHDSGGLVIVKDKDCFDRRAARDKIVKSMSRNFYLIGREWPYKNVKRRIIAEVFLKCDGMEDLVDYKFYCFNGTPLFCQVICNRSSDETIDFYDMDWKHQSFSGLTSARLSSHEFPRPHNFSKMREIAMLLSANLPFVRVDLYNIRGKIYFGEITFYPAAGFGSFIPIDWNRKLGELIKLPS